MANDGVLTTMKFESNSNETTGKKARLDFLLYAAGMAWAYFTGWSTEDLVWSLWLGSLSVGSLTIMSTAVARHLFDRRWEKQNGGSSVPVGDTLMLLVMTLFTMVHFTMFHAGHSAFVQEFFPLEGLDRQTFGEIFIHPVTIWYGVAVYLLPKYWSFILLAVVVQRHDIWKPFSELRRIIAIEQNPAAVLTRPATHILDDHFVEPYTNVMRMHCLIFFFMACHILEFEGFWVYAVVYSVYFLPRRKLDVRVVR